MTLRICSFSNKRHKDVLLYSVTLTFKFDVPSDRLVATVAVETGLIPFFVQNNVDLLNVSYHTIPSIQPITHLDTSQSRKLAFLHSHAVIVELGTRKTSKTARQIAQECENK